MSTSLVIVESPAKAKTVSRYLGDEFVVLASYGHVRDLLPKNGAVDTKNDFSMQYHAIEKNAKHVNQIIKELKKATTLYLATDPDREGESIAWHLYELLKERGAMKDKALYRIVFHEVTKHAILEAVNNPKSVSMDLVNAQQARRALDYLVGFNLSPLLWKKIQQGLSAGRVQSPALRMIAEREIEIEKFIVKEYWSIEADLEKTGSQFVARLTLLKNEKCKQFDITDEAKAIEVHAELQKLSQNANNKLKVIKIEKKQRKRNPVAPFITSTLQQEAVRKLGLTAQNAMRIAQQLYEGVDIGDSAGNTGLITYMRTDSTVLAKSAQDEIIGFIGEKYGKDQLPDKVRVFKTKSKNAQEAHEAIRPTSIRRMPIEMKKCLDSQQYRLYELIWQRTIASQMKHATIDTVAADLECGGGNAFRANGSVISDLGFMVVYQEGYDDVPIENTEKLLPKMQVDDWIALMQIRKEQHFTEPPPRYTEASLVQTLEKYGIGRPSTYASIISTLRQREYVDFENKRFTPTDVGRTVNNFLTKHFSDYVDYDFTARFEDQLDAVSRGEKEWIPLLHEFWDSFEKQIKIKEETVSRSEAIQARELGIDTKTGLPVSVRMGRFGPYAQIGTKDNEEKPKFAALRLDQKLDKVNLEEVLELFKLPRSLGKTDTGQEVIASAGRFGPYIRYGDPGKFVSLKEEDPYTIDLAVALNIIAAKEIEDKAKQINFFEEANISVLNGRYGPYVTDGNKNVKISKDVQPESLTLEDCQRMIAEAPDRKFNKKKKKTVAKKKSSKVVSKKKAIRKKSTVA